MNKLQALTALRDKVKAGSIRPSDSWMPYIDLTDRTAGILPWRMSGMVGAYHGSLDAAKALHEAVLPELGWSISDCMAKLSDSKVVFSGYNETSARAWLLAILEALIAQEYGKSD